MRFTKILLVFVVFARAGWADTTTTWVQFLSHFDYKDAGHECSGEGRLNNDLYLRLDFEGGELASAAFQSDPLAEFPDRLVFSSEEVAALKLYTDGTGRRWVQDLSLDETQTAWALTHSTEAGWGCTVPADIGVIQPTPLDYAFDTNQLGNEVLVTYSKSLSFTGSLKSGRPFQASLSLDQYKWEGPGNE